MGSKTNTPKQQQEQNLNPEQTHRYRKQIADSQRQRVGKMGDSHQKYELSNFQNFYKVFCRNALTDTLTSVKVVPVFPKRTIKTARFLGFKAWIEILNPGVSKSPSTISNDAVLEQVWQNVLEHRLCLYQVMLNPE